MIMKMLKMASKKSILFAGAAMVITVGIGLVSMSGAKFTSNVDTGVGSITAGVLKPLEYTFKDSDGNPVTAGQITTMFSKVYPGWTEYIDVTVKTSADTNLNADWAPLFGGTFIGTPTTFDGRITVNVAPVAGDFTPAAGVDGKTLSQLVPLAETYNDTTSTTNSYVSLGTGKLNSAGSTETTFRLTFTFQDADAGNTDFTDMITYDANQADNQYMGDTAAFSLVLKAVILDQN